MNVSDSIIKPLRPRKIGTKRNEWHQWPNPTALISLGYPCERWYLPERMIQVLSAVEVAQDSDGSSNGPEYHISISSIDNMRVERVDSRAAQWVLEQFGLEGSEEDNHVPTGKVRNFWRPVADRLVGKECECKADEPVVREDNGDFEWRPIK